MIVFHNPGVLPLDAIRLQGVSVKRPGSFGRFGTGLKYAIATILRGGGSISLYTGGESYAFYTRSVEVKGEAFEQVCLSSLPALEPLSFTTAYGRDWEPWMALRELACNARDEGGDWSAKDLPECFSPKDDTTVIVVEWDQMEQAARFDGDLFATGEVLHETDDLRVMVGPSQHLYYRGVRVMKLEKPSRFRYDLKAEMRLTEDRTLSWPWEAFNIIREHWLTCDDADLVAGALLTDRESLEDQLDYTESSTPPSRTFIDVVVAARDRKDGKLVKSAREAFMKHARANMDAKERHYGGTIYQDTNLSRAVDALSVLGLEDIRDQDVLLVEELPGEARSMLENGRTYMLRSMLKEPSRAIATELALRWAERRYYYQHDTAEAFVEMLLDQHPDTRMEERRGEQDDDVIDLEPAPAPAELSVTEY